jgi:hypothetical protein
MVLVATIAFALERADIGRTCTDTHIDKEGKNAEQAGAELCQAQVKLKL